MGNASDGLPFRKNSDPNKTQAEEADRTLSSALTGLPSVILDSLGVSVAALDRDGTVVATSFASSPFPLTATSHLSRSAPDLAVGQNYLEFSKQVFTTDGPVVPAGIASVLAGTRTHFSWEYRFPSAEVERWYLMTAARLPSVESGAVISHIDITEQKKSVTQRGQIMENARCLLWSSDVEEIDGRLSWKMTYFDEATARKQVPLEAPPGDAFLWRWHEVRLPVDRAHNYTVAERSIRAGQDYGDEFRMLGDDGRQYWIQETVRVHTLLPGKKWTVVGLCSDITLYKQAEEEAHRWGRVFEAADFGLAYVDAVKNTFITVNPAFAIQRGFSPEELEGKPIRVLHPPGQQADTTRLLEQINRQDHSVLETMHRRKDGSTFPVMLEVTNIRDVDGSPISRIVYALDISDQKRTDQERAYLMESAHCLLWHATAYTTTTEEGVTWDVFFPPDEIAQRFLSLSIPPGSTYQQAFQEAIFEEDRAAYLAHIINHLRIGTDFALEFRVRPTAGGIYWIHSTVRVEVIEPGKRWRMVGVLIDVTERKTVEIAIREEKDRLKRIASTVPGAIHTFRMRPDKTFCIPYSSPQIQELYDLCPEELAEDACTMLDRILPEDSGPLFEAILESAATLTLFHEEFRYQHPTRGIVWVEVRSVPVPEPDGGTLWSGMLTDVTERKRAEVLAEGQRCVLEMIARGADLSETLNELLVVIETYCPELFCSLHLLDAAGLHLRNGVSPRLPFVYMKALDGLAIGPKAGSCGTAAFRKEAVIVEDIATDPLWDEYRDLALPYGMKACWSTPIFDGHDRVLGTFAVYYTRPMRPTAEHIKMIAEATHTAAVCLNRYLAEIALREEQDRFSRIAATVPGVIYSFRLRPDGTLSLPYASPSLHEIFDVDPRWLREDGSLIFSFIHVDDLDKVQSSIISSARTLADWNSEFRVNHPRKGIIWVEGRSTPIPETDGGVLWHGFLSDVTERKQAEEAIYQLNAELEQRVKRRTLQLAQAKEEAEAERIAADDARREAEQANFAKSEFLSRMSHELRTPLNSILGFAQIMEMTASDEKQTTRVNHILKAGRHLLGLINEVLDITRVEAGRLHLSPEPVDLAQCLHTVLDLVRPLYEQKSLSVFTTDREYEGVYVLADLQRLSQVLLNLLSNAIKYNRQNGAVHIHCETRSTGWIRLNIRDTGPGIPKASLTRLFQPFERLEAESTLIEGTGLGLALSKRLITAMGGNIGVESEAGQGSTFYIELPRAEKPIQISGTISNPVLADVAGRHYTILYIEDNLANLRLIEELLEERKNIRLLTATQGKQGLKLARECRPSLVLLDLHLPDISGDDVLKAIKADPDIGAIPVVILTASAGPKLTQQLRDAGATEYVTKPIDIPDFLSMITRLLSSSEH